MAIYQRLDYSASSNWSDLAEVSYFATKWLWSYNHDRPKMALGGFTPEQRLAVAAERYYFRDPCQR